MASNGSWLQGLGRNYFGGSLLAIGVGAAAPTVAVSAAVLSAPDLLPAVAAAGVVTMAATRLVFAPRRTD